MKEQQRDRVCMRERKREREREWLCENTATYQGTYMYIYVDRFKREFLKVR